ncbi:MAG: hypothetical protein KDB74_06645 [Flavobacteriales bacterium]|nr:hypothetical protein [Flavobacteriales bacterium]
MVLNVFKFVENINDRKTVKFIGYLEMEDMKPTTKKFEKQVIKSLYEQGFISKEKMCNLTYSRDEYIEIDDAVTGEPLFNLLEI